MPLPRLSQPARDRDRSPGRAARGHAAPRRRPFEDRAAQDPDRAEHAARQEPYGLSLRLTGGLGEELMAIIPPLIREHVAIPIVDGKMSFADVCLIGSVLPDGYAQITPRGSTMAFDESHLALWERGRGSTNAELKDGKRLTVFMRRSALRQAGVSSSGVVRFHGIASLHKAGPIY